MAVFMSNASSLSPSRSVTRWLLVMVILVIAMIVLGGATRLTNSGLSITEWKPITGALPPLSTEQWLIEFDKYKQIPEFSAEHPNMSLEGFRFIYFMEWSHRQLGRLIGLAFVIPFFFFAIKRQLPKGRVFRFFLIMLLIGAQGAIGWWMVASGLTNDRTDVSQYRLAAHLSMAFLILGLLYWTYKDQKDGWGFRRETPAYPWHGFLIALFVFLQIIAGAFVAGTHAGKTYNTWPLMDGKFFPEGYSKGPSFWQNLGENITAIQFNHRVLAYIVCLLVVLYLLRVRSLVRVRGKAIMLVVLVMLQIALGVWTLLNVAPLNLSLAHQFLAIFVFISSVSLWRSAKLGS